MNAHKEALRFAEQRERAAKEDQAAMERVDQILQNHLSKVRERKDGRSI